MYDNDSHHHGNRIHYLDGNGSHRHNGSPIFPLDLLIVVSDSYNDGGYDGGPIFPFDLLIVVRDSYDDGGYDVPNR